MSIPGEIKWHPPTNVQKLEAEVRKAHEENARLREALEFYARSEHFEYNGTEHDEDYEPETVSGEPQNWLCGRGDFTFEDGFIARAALEGK